MFPAIGKDEYYSIQPVEGKGNGAFASKNIKPGTRILLDEALILIHKPTNDIEEADLEAALPNLDAAACAQFMQLFVSTAYLDPPESPLYSRFVSNWFALIAPDRGGCFAHASRFNHSCLPNCLINPTDRNQQQCHVIKNVEAGDELTFAYNAGVFYMTFEERAAYFKRTKNTFDICCCTLCQLPPDVRAESDKRRRRMRVLFFILTGEEVPHTPSIFTDEDRAKRVKGALPLNLVNEYTKLAEVEGNSHNLFTRFCYASMAKTWVIRAIEGDSAFRDIDHFRGLARRALVLKREYLGTQLADVQGAETQERKIQKFCELVVGFPGSGEAFVRLMPQLLADDPLEVCTL